MKQNKEKAIFSYFGRFINYFPSWNGMNMNFEQNCIDVEVALLSKEITKID